MAMGIVDIMVDRMGIITEAIVDIMDTVILHIMGGPIMCHHILPLITLVIIIVGMVVAIRKL